MPSIHQDIWQFFKHPKNNLPINIVFLDIDGVLLPSSDGNMNRKAFKKNLSFIQSKLGEAYKELDLYDIGATLLFSKQAVAHLKQLCKKTNAHIVISSQWRSPYDRESSLRKLRLLFKLWDLDHLIIDETPHLMKFGRAKEIQAWLDEYKNGKISAFVILDDIDLSREFPANLVHTEDKMFFSEEHLNKALSILTPSAFHPVTSSNIQGLEFPHCKVEEMPVDFQLHMMPWLTNQLWWCFGLVLQTICASIASTTSTDVKTLSFCNTTRYQSN